MWEEPLTAGLNFIYNKFIRGKKGDMYMDSETLVHKNKNKTFMWKPLLSKIKKKHTHNHSHHYSS